MPQQQSSMAIAGANDHEVQHDVEFQGQACLTTALHENKMVQGPK